MVDQIAICTVDLNAVETGGNRVLCGVDIVGDNARNFRQFECARLDIGLLALCSMCVAGRSGRRRGHRLRSTQKVGVDKTAHVPELKNDPPTTRVNFVGNRLPCSNLIARPDTGGRWPAEAFLRNTGGLGNQQTRIGALAVIFGLQFTHRHMASIASPASQRCHQNPVGRFDCAEGDWVEKSTAHKISRIRLWLGAKMRISVSNCNGGL